MFDFFDKVIDTISSLVSFLGQMILGLFRLIGLIPEAVNTLSHAVGYLPSIIATFAAVTITVSVIFIIVGRDGGGQK